MKRFITLSLLMVSIYTLNAQAIFTRTFTGTGSCPTQDNGALSGTGWSSPSVSRNTITCNSTANVFNSTTLNNTASLSTSSYIEYSISATSGYELQLTSTSFFRQASASAPDRFRLRYSTDGFSTFTDFGSDITSPTSGTTFTWTFGSTIITTGTVTFRIYPFGTTRADGGAGASATGTYRIDDLVINGSVVATSGPPVVTASVFPTSGSETAGTTVTIAASASSAPLTNITVNYTVSGTGITSSDFVSSPSLSGTLTILAGNTTASTTLQIFDDTDAEGTETATFTITSVTGGGGATLGTPASGAFTIADNDEKYFWNGGDITANPVNGGTGTWNTTNAWRQPSATGAQATWANGFPAIFQATAGVVSIPDGTTQSPSSIEVKTTNYTFTSNGGSATTLNGNITLDPAVTLQFNDATTTANRTLYIHSVTGGPNSSITIQGAQTGSNVSRVDLNASGASINVPVSLQGTYTTGNPLIGIVGRQPNTSVNAAITNNSTIRTMIGATSGNTLNINATIQGTQGVQFSAGSSGGAGTVVLNAASTYSQSTLFNLASGGTVRLGVNNGLPTTTQLNMGWSSGNGGTLDLNAYNQTVAALSSNGGVGRIINNATGTSVFTVNGNVSSTYALTLEDGAGAGRVLKLVKGGTGELTLSGTNTFTGGLDINGGKIILGNGNIIANTCSLKLNGGVFRTGTTTGFNETVDVLELSNNSTIELGSGNHSLNFANSSSITWAAGKTLTIKNWLGAPLSSGTQGKIFVGVGGLTATQLAQVQFDGFGPGAAIITGGELVPLSASLVVDDINIAPGSFGTISAGTCSAEKSFDVYGASLPTDVVITPVSGFQISTTSGSGFTSLPITLTVTGGTLSTTTIYVKFCPSAAIAYSGNITVASGVTLNVAVNGTGEISTYYSQASGTAETDTIWSYVPVGTPQTIASLGGFSSTRNVQIQSGHTVVVKNSVVLTAKNLAIETGGVLKGAPLTPGASVATPYYINVYGDINVDGSLGQSGGLDSLGLNYEGTSGAISGGGEVHLARIRKSNNTPNATSNLDIEIDLNIYWNGTAIYNNQSASTFNFTQNAGTINFVNNGDITVDGTNGLGSGNRNGTFAFYGTVNGLDTVYAFTDNTSGVTGITIGNFGAVSAKRVIRGRVGTTGVFGLNVNAGGILFIEDFLELQSGTFAPAGKVVLRSNAQNQCAYINNFSTGFTGVYSGNVNAERFVPVAGSNQHFISVPVSGITFADLSASGPDGQFVTPTPDCDETQSATGTAYGTVFQYVDGNMPNGQCMLGNWMVRSSGSLVTAKGYSAYLDGNTKIGVEGAPFTGNTSVPTFNSSFVTVPTKQGAPIQSGWNLVGNPYPSAIDLTIDRTAAGFSNEVQVWQTSGPFSGSWQTLIINGVPGTVVIPPFQAFFVRQISAGAGSYPFYQSERTKTATTNFYSLNQANQLVLELETKDGVKDQTRIAFNADATTAIDPMYDASKMSGSKGRPTIYSLAPNAQWMAVNTLPELQTETTIPVSLRPELSTQMTISAIGLATFDPTVYVYLEDKFTGTYHNLRNGGYIFNTTKTDAYNRFVLHFTPAAQIDVVNASCEDNNGIINITQQGPANWSYTISKDEVIIATGQLNQNNSIAANELSSGVYQLTLTDALGYTVVKNIPVDAPQTPSAAFNVSAINITQNQWIDFVATEVNSDYSYEWNFGDGTVSFDALATYAYQQSGVYQSSLKVTSSTGCTNSASQLITVTDMQTTGTHSLNNSGVKVWSNSNVINVKLLNQSAAQIEIYNTVGQLLMSKTVTDGAGTFELINTAGLVLVKVNTTENSYSQMVTIN